MKEIYRFSWSSQLSCPEAIKSLTRNNDSIQCYVWNTVSRLLWRRDEIEMWIIMGVVWARKYSPPPSIERLEFLNSALTMQKHSEFCCGLIWALIRQNCLIYKNFFLNFQALSLHSLHRLGALLAEHDVYVLLIWWNSFSNGKKICSEIQMLEIIHTAHTVHTSVRTLI